MRAHTTTNNTPTLKKKWGEVTPVPSHLISITHAQGAANRRNKECGLIVDYTNDEKQEILKAGGFARWVCLSAPS